MKLISYAATRAAIVSIALSAVSSTVLASDDHGRKCKAVTAEIVAVQFAQDCRSPVGLCTAGSIEGNLGLNGTTSFVGDSIGAGLDTAPDAPATLAFSGIVRITTAKDGTLTLRDTGVFNTAANTPTGGFFASFDRIESGTGRYAGATGSIFITGKTVKGRLVAQITGELCLR
jgi:hypothetical protein